MQPGRARIASMAGVAGGDARQCAHALATPALAACRAGYGGPLCVACGKGSYSAGGTLANLKPPCTNCAAGWTTSAPGATSKAACSE